MYNETEHPSAVRAKNRAAILKSLHINGEVSRKKLAAMLQLTPAAMTKIVAELLREGLVKECGAVGATGAGRREIKLSLVGDARCALGISLGLGSAILSAVRLDGSVLFSKTVPLPVRAEAEPTVSALAENLLSLMYENGIEMDRVIGAGVTVRGMIGTDGRTVKSSFDSLDSDDYPICDRLEAKLGCPVLLANNVRALALAQIFCSREAKSGSSFFVHCGTGIGAALIVDDKVLRGKHDQCAEIGHIPVVRRGGKPCHCGKTGCLETVASPAAIRESAQTILSPLSTPMLWKLT